MCVGNGLIVILKEFKFGWFIYSSLSFNGDDGFFNMCWDVLYRINWFYFLFFILFLLGIFVFCVVICCYWEW